MFEDAFRPLVAAGKVVVCLTLMASLSGTFNAARTAAAGFPAGSVHVVDSESVTGGLALQAIRAADLARTGVGVDAILDALVTDQARQRGYATVPDLSYAVRNGRISKAQAFLGSLVKIVPVLRIDSGTIGQARVRTFARASSDDRCRDARKGIGDSSRRSAGSTIHARAGARIDGRAAVAGRDCDGIALGGHRRGRSGDRHHGRRSTSSPSVKVRSGFASSEYPGAGA